jgi:MFS family permease
MKLDRALLARHTAPAKRLLMMVTCVDLVVSNLMLAVQFLGLSLHAPPVVLGLLGTLAWGTYASGCFVLGGVSDRIGRRFTVAAGALLLLAVCLGLTRVRHQALLLALMPLMGLSLALVWPSLQAWLAELGAGCGRRMHRYLSAFNIFWAGGAMIGPLTAGRLWEMTPAAPFLFSAAVLAVLLALLAAMPRPPTCVPATEPLTDTALSPEMAHTFMLMAWVANFSAGFASGCIVTMFPKLGESLHYPPALTSSLIFGLYAAQAVIFLAARLTRAWRYRLGVLLVSQCLGAVGLGLLAVVASPSLFALGFTVYGISNAVSYLSSLTYTLEGTSTARARRSSFHEAIGGSGIIMGPLVGGLAAQAINLRAPFVASAIVLLVGVIAQGLLWRRCRRLPEPPPDRDAVVVCR